IIRTLDIGSDKKVRWLDLPEESNPALGMRGIRVSLEKRELFLRGLRDINIAHTEPQGAYYILLDISEFGYESDLEFCEDLARLVGVGAVPGSSFFKEPENRYIRFHFAKKNETLNEALNRLSDIRKKIKVRKVIV
ncbi:MAG: aminotransferase class I/II-fold pyridoxal phosphate-dependent enzyme, partial [Clostridia bacterium]|nr:aminotransferase class I/II-fold pyridoxal phosphate-dependent enzyme [Clostridia bacterium]